MYVREVKSGGHAYLSLAHNRRDPDSGQVKAEVLYNFGRKDRIDQNALRRLVRSLARFLEPGEVEQLAGSGALGDLGAFVRAKRLGGTHVLDGIWARLGIDEALRGLLKARRFRTPVERLLFALVAQRALNPGSKLDVESWVRDETHVNGLEQRGRATALPRHGLPA
ncbi:MAG: hypothetical protein U5K81_06920 [Trueperaceae bacterium]|nr:hypothetical protein [Trueperaceae bacterium]